MIIWKRGHFLFSWDSQRMKSIHLERYPKIRSSPTLQVWFLHLFHMDIFQRVFEIQLRSRNENCLLQLENLLLNIKYVRERTFARANYVSYLSLTRIFTISRWLGGSRMGHYNEKRKSYIQKQFTFLTHRRAQNDIEMWRRAARRSSRLIQHLELHPVRSKSRASKCEKLNKRFIF